MNKKYAIFDMDGTLVDSMPVWRGLAREYLESKGVYDFTPKMIDEAKHLTMLETAAMFIRCYGLEGTPESVAAGINGMMAEHYRTDIPMKDGVADYLRRLKERGVHMSVASATVKPLIEICLKRLGILDYFEAVYSCEEVGVGKLHPDVYNAAAKAMGSTPEETAVYEDALHAGRTAKAAGYYLVGLYDETGSFEWPEMQKLADESYVTLADGVLD